MRGPRHAVWLALAAWVVGIAAWRPGPAALRPHPLHRSHTAAPPPRCCACAGEDEYLRKLDAVSLPAGFRVGVCGFEFSPVELGGSANAVMNLTLIALDEPTPDYAAVFTRNRFPGAPVKVGRRRLAAAAPLQAVVVNNKISNVCSAGDGEADSEAVCSGAADALGLDGGAAAVLPLSTGVIGWRLPVDRMIEALPEAAAALSAGSALPAARSIMTTDRFPKLRSVSACGGTLVGFAKVRSLSRADFIWSPASPPPAAPPPPRPPARELWRALIRTAASGRAGIRVERAPNARVQGEAAGRLCRLCE